MGQLTNEPFRESCCDGGGETLDDLSAQPCGCDKGANWVCQWHRDQTLLSPANRQAIKDACETLSTQYQPLPGTLVIGLGHKARHGKDSAAQFLIEKFPQYVRRFAFADALRTYCRVLHGMTIKDAPLLQRVGVEMREKNPNIWIDTLYWQLIEQAPPIAVITDVRFENEARFVKSMGGTLIRVTRWDMTTDQPYQATDRDPNHISETELELFPWDHSILAPSVKALGLQLESLFQTIDGVPHGR